MTHTHSNICLVNVPEGSKMHYAEDDYLVYKFKDDGLYDEFESVPLTGPWRFVCLSTEMTEEKAAQIVEAFDQVVVTYYRRYGKKGEVCYTALASFASLLTALGCDPNGTYAVLINATP